MRREYVLTDAQLERILRACESVPYIIVGGSPPRSPQERANDAWMIVGAELGFRWDTVLPTGPQSFTAESEEEDS